MEPKDEKYLILEQYRIYSDAKEKFIDRQFTTNKFYLVLNLIILVVGYIVSTLTPQYMPVILLSAIGLVMSFMWWMNIDSYGLLIKVKYAKVLEYLETKLPEQPYHKEFMDYAQLKNQKNIIVFGDIQKFLALIIIFAYIITIIVNGFNAVRTITF